MDFFERVIYDVLTNVVALLIITVVSPFIIKWIRKCLLKKIHSQIIISI
jgi:hypothetical protein